MAILISARVGVRDAGGQRRTSLPRGPAAAADGTPAADGSVPDAGNSTPPPSWWIRSIPWSPVGTRARGRRPAPVRCRRQCAGPDRAAGAGRPAGVTISNCSRRATAIPTCPRWDRPPRSARTAGSPSGCRCRPCHWVGPACTRCRSSRPEPRGASASGWAAPPPSCPGYPIRCPRACPIGWAWPVLDQPRHVPADPTLATEIAPDGRLDALLAAPTAVPQAKVTPVVDPGLLDELDRLVQAGAANPALAAAAANAQRQLARLRALSGKVAPIALPYGNVDVSALVANGRAGDVTAAIQQYGLPRAAAGLGAKPDQDAGDAAGRMRQPRRSREASVGGGHGRRAERGLPARRPRADLHTDGAGAHARRRSAPERTCVRPDAEPHGSARTVAGPHRAARGAGLPRGNSDDRLGAAGGAAPHGDRAARRLGGAGGVAAHAAGRHRPGALDHPDVARGDPGDAGGRPGSSARDGAPAVRGVPVRGGRRPRPAAGRVQHVGGRAGVPVRTHAAAGGKRCVAVPSRGRDALCGRAQPARDRHRTGGARGGVARRHADQPVRPRAGHP